MNYIKQLQADLESADKVIDETRDKLTDILTYLASDKFSGIDNDWVSAREMYNLLNRLRVEVCR